MPAPTPGLCLEYLPLSDGGARLVRLYGDTPCPVLPERVDGRPLTELGPYCFAPVQRARLLPPPETLRRYSVPGGPGPDAAGRASSARPEDPSAPSASSRPGEADLPRIAGGFLEELTLPGSLCIIGEAAFYDCRRLRCLCFGRQLASPGSDAFTNTFALRQLVVRAAPAQPTGLARVLACLPGEVRAVFTGEPNGGRNDFRADGGDAASFSSPAAPLAVLWYPEYWEDVEETPAHILLHTFSGQGYHYRQCFAGGAPAFAEYDAVLHQTGEGDAPATLAMLAFDRLRFPWALGERAAADYRAYLAAGGHAVLCARRLLQEQDTDALRALLALGVLDAAGLEQAAGLAARAENAEAAALLADALRRQRAGRKKRYDFEDF